MHVVRQYQCLCICARQALKANPKYQKDSIGLQTETDALHARHIQRLVCGYYMHLSLRVYVYVYFSMSRCLHLDVYVCMSMCLRVCLSMS